MRVFTRLTGISGVLLQRMGKATSTIAVIQHAFGTKVSCPGFDCLSTVSTSFRRSPRTNQLGLACVVWRGVGSSGRITRRPRRCAKRPSMCAIIVSESAAKILPRLVGWKSRFSGLSEKCASDEPKYTGQARLRICSTHA